MFRPPVTPLRSFEQKHNNFSKLTNFVNRPIPEVVSLRRTVSGTTCATGGGTGATRELGQRQRCGGCRRGASTRDMPGGGDPEFFDEAICAEFKISGA